MSVIPATQEAEAGGLQVQGHPWEEVSNTLPPKQNTNKRAEGILQVVECLPHIHKTLSSIPVLQMKKKNGNNPNVHQQING
jgi:hypothetical protein